MTQVHRYFIGRTEMSEEEFKDREGPASFVESSFNFTKAVGRVMKSVSRGKGVIVSGEEQTRRMAICATCEFFTGKSCRKCGCHIRFKAKLQTEHCPIGKW